MTITKTSQGFNLFQSLDSNHVVKMHYIGYSLTECKRRFRALVKEQKQAIKEYKNIKQGIVKGFRLSPLKTIKVGALSFEV